MTALFIIIPILIVAGAFLWMRPSPRDQQLAKLRSAALVNGLRIGSLKVPDTSEYGRVNAKNVIVTIYQLSLELLEAKTSSFVVLRTSGEAGAYLPNGWAWEQRDCILEGQYSLLSDLLENLPMSVTAVCLDNEHASLSWDEFDETVTFDDIKTWLGSVAVGFNRKLVSQS
jgi:hypothetical protein